MLTASERAAQKLKETLLRKWFDVGLGFRVIKDTNDSEVTTCSIKLDNKRADDEVIESHGIKVFLDPISATQLKDWELDYLSEPTEGFILTRPDIEGPNRKSLPGSRSGLTKGGQER